MSVAIRNTVLYGDVAVTILDSVLYPDAVAEIADFLLRMETLSWTVCLAPYQGFPVYLDPVGRPGCRGWPAARSAAAAWYGWGARVECGRQTQDLTSRLDTPSVSDCSSAPQYCCSERRPAASLGQRSGADRRQCTGPSTPPNHNSPPPPSQRERMTERSSATP